MNVFDILKKNTKKNPKKIALILNEKEYSYEEFFKKLENTIKILKQNKISNRSVVLVVEDNTFSHILSIFALSYLNACIVPASTYYSYDHLKKLIKISKVNSLIANSKYCSFFKNTKNIKNIISTDKVKKFSYFFKRAQSKINLKNIKINTRKNFIISLSSGSTGNPKPIIFTQETKIKRFLLMKKLYKINDKDVVTLTCPLDHSLGMRILFLSLLSGATIIIMNKFKPLNYFNIVKRYSVSFSVLVANQIYELQSYKKEFRNFFLKKGLVSASAKLDALTKKKIISKNINLFEMYGASEIGTVTSINIKKEIKHLKSVGRIYSKLIKIKILSKNNKFLPANNPGEIICKTPGLFKGYLGTRKINEEAFFKNFFRTGDVGYLDKKNFLYFLSRKKNIIRRSGITIYPEDIEKTLLNDKNVKEAAVIGGKGKFSEKIYLFIKKEKKINQNYIKNICIKKLSTFQIPNEILLIKDMPKSILGKINKNKLRKYLI